MVTGIINTASTTNTIKGIPTDFFTAIILGLLSLDTIRALLAMLGWINPDWRFAWIFYGRYERTLLLSALKELGYSQDKSVKIVKSMKKHPGNSHLYQV